MNVQLEGIGQGNVIDGGRTTSYGAARTSGKDVPGGYTLDISGAVTDNSAYAGHGKTTEDIMCDAMTTETALQSQYLTVMSNSVSEEDFANLTEEGFKPCDTDVETAVTVVDEIKAALAEAGIVVDGYNDDLDPEVLKEITGSEARAQEITRAFHQNDIPVTEENVRDVMQAIEKSRELTEPADGTVIYMVRQGMEPTVDDLYLAQHSTGADGGPQSYGYYDQNGSGYYAKRAEDYDWDALQEQIERVIREAGLKEDKESTDQARFLIEEGIPLTAESLSCLARLREISYPVSEERTIHAAAAAISDGKRAGDADVANPDSAWRQAVYWKEQTDRISDEAVREAAESGEKLDLRHLSALQERIDMQSADENGAVWDDGAAQKGAAYPASAVAEEGGPDPDKGDAAQAESGMGSPYIRARRQLEELRLQMTITANYSLIKRGFALDTTELSQLVEELRAAENERQQKLFGGESVSENETRKSLFNETIQAREKLYMAPAALAGRMAGAKEAWSLRYTAEQSEQLRSAYELAGERYEIMMTQPRTDLGDSIRKAFRNVDDLLRDMGIETNEENRRAVRILGYNRMEVTKEQIDRVKAADMSLQRVTEKMTPASVLHMIREGKNPLSMTVPELEEYLTHEGDNPASDQEKYSEYLYKLERTNGITDEEKESYIGIYRLFRQIEKSDGAVIGSLVNQNAELTMRNLLSAVRTGRHKGLDLEVSDHYGALREIARTDITIDEQIMSAYENQICGRIYDTLEPAALHEMDLNENPTLERLYEMLREASAKEEVREEIKTQERQYQSGQLAQMREAAELGEEHIRALLDANQPVSANALMAVQAMRSSRNRAFSKLYEPIKEDTAGGPLKEAQETFLRAAEDVRDSLTDSGTAEAAYEAFTKAGEELLAQRGFADRTYMDVRAYQLIGRQLTLAAGMAREEQYRVPVEIDGQVTALDVKIRHDKGTQGCVGVAMEHDSFGRVGVELEMTSASSITGYLAYSSREGEPVLAAAETRFRELLKGEGIQLTDFHSIFSRELNPDSMLSQGLRQDHGQGGHLQTVDARDDHRRDNHAQDDQMQSADGRVFSGSEREHVRTSVLYTVAKSFVAAMQDTAVRRKEINGV